MRTSIQRALTKLKAAYPNAGVFSEVILADVARALSSYADDVINDGVNRFIRQNRYPTLSDLYNAVDEVADEEAAARLLEEEDSLENQPTCPYCGGRGFTLSFYQHAVTANPCVCKAGVVLYPYRTGQSVDRDVPPLLRYTEQDYNNEFGKMIWQGSYESRHNGSYVDHRSDATDVAYKDRFSADAPDSVRNAPIDEWSSRFGGRHDANAPETHEKAPKTDFDGEFVDLGEET